MSQQGSGRYWLVVALFLSLNAAGLVWIRHAWAPQDGVRVSRLVTLDVTPEQPRSRDNEAAVFTPPVIPPETAKSAPKVAEPVRIVAWLPISNSTSALVPENILPDEHAIIDSKDQFDAAERLIAVFDRAVVGEGELSRPLEHPPFQITPQVAGHWRWTSPNRLAFVLDNPLPPGRKFELASAIDFDDRFQSPLARSSRQFQFETRSLKWLDAKLMACDRNAVTFELSFNQPVAPGDLERAMAVSDSNLPARPPAEDHDSPFAAPQSPHGPVFDVTVLTREPASRLVVQTRRPSRSLQIAIGRFLKGHSAELPLGNVRTRELSLPTAFSLLRSDVYPMSFENDVTVNLYFSHGLSADQERPKVKVTPAVEDLRIELAPRNQGLASYHPDLVLRGRFLCGQQYSLQLPQTILACDGQTLGEVSPIRINVPHRPADLRITAGQGILIPDGNLTLDVQCVNISGVRMSASRLHANNLTSFLQSRHNDSATMRSIVHERQRSLDLIKDTPQTVALDLRQLLGVDKERSTRTDGQVSPSTAPLAGIYRVSINDANEYWNRDAATVAITDLGLTAKRCRDGWLVWVLSLRSAAPQAGVTVAARSFNNQVLAQSTTNADGIASLSIPDNHPDGPAWLLTAERAGDLNYLQPDRNAWMMDSVDQSGRAWPEHYEAMLYTERGVYRPGDTIHLTGILRDRLGHTPPSFPLSIAVTRPDGRVVAQLPCQPHPDQQGVFQVDYLSSETGQSGIYRFDASIPGSRQSLGSTTAQIEAFVPIRIAVEARTGQPRTIRQNPTVHVQGRYLFGQPASSLNVTANGMWQRIAFTSREYSEYQFGDFSGRNQIHLAEVNQTLDEEGTKELTLDAPRDEKPGIWAATVTATVIETGGRSVSTACRVETDTAGIHLGVKPPEKKVVAVGEPASFDWVAVNGQGTLTDSRPFDVSLARVDYDTNVAQVNGRPVWKTVERLINVETKKIDEDEPKSSGSLSFICPVAGRYRLRMVDPDSKSSTQIEFYAATHRSDRVDVPLQQPEQLDLVLDQTKYRQSDLARVLVRSPFPGRILLTLEGDRVHNQRVLTLEANSQLIELQLPAELRGGAYVSATVIRAIDPQQADWLPHRAYGLARLVVDSSSRELPLKLEAASDTLPGSILKVKAQLAGWVGASRPVTPNPEIEAVPKKAPLVHLWAVDEGILLTTRYSTPKPLDFFHKPRKLGVTTSDIYGNLLPDHLRPVGMTRIGADAGEKNDGEVDGSRRSPVDMPRRTPAVVWQTVQPVGDDGSLTIDIPVPQLTGALRLMAVAVHGDSYGSTDHRVTVASPLLVECTWPRCAVPGDHFRVPIKLFNTTTAALSVKVSAVVSGPVSVRMAGSSAPETITTVTVEPNQPLVKWLNVTGLGLGIATVRVEATATQAGGKSLDAFTESSMAVRMATPLDSETSITRQQVGEPLILEPSQGFIEGTTRTSIAVSGLPSVELNPALDSLIDYPYGCGEQTSSRLYALVAARDWLTADKAADNGSGTDRSRSEFVAQLINMGVVRLWSMQTHNGGIGYWSGGQSDPWVSAYAAGAIIAARDAGTAVDETFIVDLSKYLESVVDGQSGVTVDDNTRAYLCRILAALNKPKQGWMSRLSEHIEFLDAEGRAHLAAAWIRLGRKDRAASVLPEETFRLTAVASCSGRITSRIRQDAVLLQVLLELDPKHVAIPGVVERLQSARQKQTWMNTLENATVIAALARYRALTTTTNEFMGTMKRGSLEQQFSQLQPIKERWSNESGPLEFSSQGQGEFFVVRTTEGLREQAQILPYDRQLKVRRQWLDRHGRQIDRARLRVGDLIHVEIRISSPGDVHGIPNVAIVDALPGGVEIENPRLATSENAGDSGSGQADHVEFLDDRAVVFTTVRGYESVFRYAVRVTTPGQFSWPPIQASSMYDPAFASVHGGGKVVVFDRDEEINEVVERPDDFPRAQ